MAIQRIDGQIGLGILEQAPPKKKESGKKGRGKSVGKVDEAP